MPINYLAMVKKRPMLIALALAICAGGFSGCETTINIRPQRILFDANTPYDPDRWQTKLHWSAECNVPSRIAEILHQSTANVDERDKYTNTPLMIAAATGAYECAQLLIDAGAEVDAKNKYDHTALTYAANCRTWDYHGGQFPSEEDVCRTIAVLLAAGANPNIQFHSRAESALTAAATHGGPERLELLLEAGADPNLADLNGRTPLMYAINNYSLFRVTDVVRPLLEAGADPNRRDSRGRTTLIVAVKRAMGHIDADLVKLLVANGSDLNLVDDYGKTAFDYALEQRMNESVIVLVDAGANCSHVGWSRLHFAAAMNDQERLTIAIEEGDDLEIGDAMGRTPLMLASWFAGDGKMVQFLIDVGANIEAIDNDGRTALSLAAGRCNENEARVLLRAGALVNNADAEGMTPLHHVSRSEFGQSTVEALVEHGALLDAKDASGRTALMYAASQCDNHIVALFLHEGADWTLVDRDNLAAVDYARNATSADNWLMQKRIDRNRRDVVTMLQTGTVPERYRMVHRGWDEP